MEGRNVNLYLENIPYFSYKVVIQSKKRERLNKFNVAYTITKNIKNREKFTLKKINKTQMICYCSKMETANRMIQDSELGKIYKMFIPNIFTQTFAVMKGVGENIEDGDMIDDIEVDEGYTIKSVNRLFYRGKKTETVIICFNGQGYPREVKLWNLKVKLEKYIPKVKICGACGLLGHIQKFCRNNIKCNNCQSFANDKHVCNTCQNCNLKHDIGGKCLKFADTTLVTLHMHENNMTYSEAFCVLYDKLSMPQMRQFPNAISQGKEITHAHGKMSKDKNKNLTNSHEKKNEEEKSKKKEEERQKENEEITVPHQKIEHKSKCSTQKNQDTVDKTTKTRKDVWKYPVKTDSLVEYMNTLVKESAEMNVMNLKNWSPNYNGDRNKKHMDSESEIQKAYSEEGEYANIIKSGNHLNYSETNNGDIFSQESEAEIQHDVANVEAEIHQNLTQMNEGEDQYPNSKESHTNQSPEKNNKKNEQEIFNKNENNMILRSNQNKNNKNKYK